MKRRTRKGGIATIVAVVVMVMLSVIAALGIWQWYNSWILSTQKTQAIVVYDERAEYNITSQTLTYTVVIANNGQKTVKLVSARDTLGNIFAAPSAIKNMDGTNTGMTTLILRPGDKYIVEFSTTYTSDPSGMQPKLILLWDDGSNTMLDMYVNAVS